MDKDSVLKWKLPEKPECFYGRERELKALEKMLHEDGAMTVFVQGIGGIGKSDLVAQYAYAHRVDYQVIVYANCVAGIKNMIVSDTEFPMKNMIRNNYDEYFVETEDEYFERKFEYLKATVDDRVLLIVDNYNYEQDEAFEQFLELPCQKIITTRKNWSIKDCQVLTLRCIEDMGALEHIFIHYYLPKEAEKNAIRAIIKKVGGHTLLVERIAKLMAEQTISVQEILALLEEKEWNMQDERDVLEILSSILHVNELDEVQKEVLCFLCFVPYSGISKEELVTRGGQGTHAAILKLLQSSLIKQVELDIVTLHPVLADAVMAELQPDWKKIEVFVDSIVCDMENDDTPIKQIEWLLLIVENMFRMFGTDGYEAIPLLVAVSHVMEKRYEKYGIAIGMIKKAENLQEQKIQSLKDVLSTEAEGDKQGGYENCKNAICKEERIRIEIIHKIGDIYYRAEKYHNALEYYMKLNAYGEMDVHCDIARVYAKVSEFRKAIDYVETGIKIKINREGPDSVSLVKYYMMLAKIYNKNGDKKMCQQYMEEAKRIATAKMDSQMLSNFYYENAMMLKEMNQTAEALKNDQLCFTLRKKIYGEKHLLVLRAYSAMAVDYYRLGDYESALECSLREIALRKQIHRVKKRLYMSVSRLIGFVNVEQLPMDTQEQLRLFMTDFNRIIRENPQEATELLRQ